MRREATSFPVTWAILMQSNSGLTVNPKFDDGGLERKIVELEPPFLMTDDPQLIEERPHQYRAARRGVGDRAQNGVYNAEVFAVARLFFKTLDEAICTGRNIAPLPARVLARACDKKAVSQETRAATQHEQSWEGARPPVSLFHCFNRPFLRDCRTKA